MKKIGLVGGISWTSTIDYYRFINEEVNRRSNGPDFAECIIYSINFRDFNTANARHDWNATAVLLTEAALNLQIAGADVILLCANTAHKVAERVKESIALPLIDIRLETAKAIRKQGLSKVGLLGTVYTMEMDFYKDVLIREGIEVIIPESKTDRDYMETTLVDELGEGVLLDTTKQEYMRIANTLVDRGAEGIILGCTEIPLLLSQADFSVPVFNSTYIHACAAADFATS